MAASPATSLPASAVQRCRFWRCGTPCAILDCSVTTKEITENGVKFLDKDGVEQFAEADYVYYCCGNRSNDDIVKSLEGVTPWFVVTGDAKRAQTVKQATYEGFCAAMDIL